MTYSSALQRTKPATNLTDEDRKNAVTVVNHACRDGAQWWQEREFILREMEDSLIARQRIAQLARSYRRGP